MDDKYKNLSYEYRRISNEERVISEELENIKRKMSNLLNDIEYTQRKENNREVEAQELSSYNRKLLGSKEEILMELRKVYRKIEEVEAHGMHFDRKKEDIYNEIISLKGDLNRDDLGNRELVEYKRQFQKIFDISDRIEKADNGNNIRRELRDNLDNREQLERNTDREVSKMRRMLDEGRPSSVIESKSRFNDFCKEAKTVLQEYIQRAEGLEKYRGLKENDIISNAVETTKSQAYWGKKEFQDMSRIVPLSKIEELVGEINSRSQEQNKDRNDKDNKDNDDVKPRIWELL